MPASAGQPSLQGYDACMVYWTEGAFGRNCRLKQRETFFSFGGFSVLSKSYKTFLGLILWHFLGWEGKASWSTLPAPSC